MKKTKVFKVRGESITPKDMNGVIIELGQKVVCIESYANKLYNGVVVAFTDCRIKIALEGVSWLRYIMPENADKMIYVKPESNE